MKGVFFGQGSCQLTIWGTILGALLTHTLGAFGLDTKQLVGHVPLAVKRLEAVGVLGASEPIRLSIGLPLRNQPALAKWLEGIYDASSPRYRKYLTPEQFTARFGPSQADYEAVIQFAHDNGLTI